MVNFNRAFGVHSNLKQGIKIWGPIYALDAFILVMTLIVVSMGNSSFFQNSASSIPKYVFDICTLVLGVYIILRPRTNPGKRNINLLILTFTPSIRFFQSITTFHYHRLHNMLDLNGKYNRRFIVTRQDVKGDKYE